jgi:hypothetical protein
VTVVTGDYSLDDTLSTELEQFGTREAFTPLLLDERMKLPSRLPAGRASIHRLAAYQQHCQYIRSERSKER